MHEFIIDIILDLNYLLKFCIKNNSRNFFSDAAVVKSITRYSIKGCLLL